MKLQLRDLNFFIEVAKRLNFSRAADSLDIPVYTLSRRIQALESDLGSPLFFRSARKVELTDNGKMFLERCNAVMSLLDSAWEELSSNMRTLRGKVRISMPVEIGHTYMREVISDFALKWPEIELHVQHSERWVDLHSDPFDLDLRLGPLPDSSLVARRLIILRPALYASPKLFDFYPMPETPEDLAKIPCIAQFQPGSAWELNTGKKSRRVTVKAVHAVSNASLAFDMALAGLGIALHMPAAATKFVESGEIIQVLPEWRHHAVELNVVMADGYIPQRVRLFIDHIAEYFAKLPE